jgi:hypothetical protein
VLILLLLLSCHLVAVTLVVLLALGQGSRLLVKAGLRGGKWKVVS